MGEVTMTGMASEALTASAIETISRIGGLVAGRAGGHYPTLLRAPHDFADSMRLPVLGQLQHVEHLASRVDQALDLLAKNFPGHADSSYAAQQLSLATSRLKVCAASLKASAKVRYGAQVSATWSVVRPNWIA